MKLINLIGQKFGKLTVIKYLGSSYWLCECECGNKKAINGKHLRYKNERTLSCGCIRSKRAKIMVEEFHKNNITHGKSKHRLYKIWQGIKDRCLNSKNQAYKNYGGRGITICKEWLKFENFYIWAINNGYKNDLTIDRINNNDIYKPSNCRWISLELQARNTRNNVNITFLGQTHCLSEWGRILKINRKKVKEVLGYGTK